MVEVLKIIGYIIFFILILTAVVGVAVLRSPKNKGRRGENRVASVLGETIAGEQYIINNLLFSSGDNHSCQIDHVFINKHGIWVIETKNYSGRIYGNEEQREWTQVLAYGNTKK